MQRRHHYEQAFEAYLRERRIPYVAVDEARKALLPHDALRDAPGAKAARVPDGAGDGSLKSFDFVIYGEGSNLLVEVKGRKLSPRTRQRAARTRLECWATLDDVESLTRWERLFGPSFEAVLVFVYWCDELPPDALFEEIFQHGDRWYAVRCVRLTDYRAAMKTRSPRWRTVDLSPREFDRLAGPLAPPGPHGLGPARQVGWSLTACARDALAPLPALDSLVGPP